MFGPDLLARTLTTPTRGSGKGFQFGREWQYHSRSDRHSKVACWGIVLDLLVTCPRLREHVLAGLVGLGINHEMRDFRNNKKKNLDLVICRAATKAMGGSRGGARAASTFRDLAEVYGIDLAVDEQAALDGLPEFPIVGVSTVLLAIESKAAMTAHLKARPRLKDELTGSYQTIHGDNDHAIAAGLVIVNAAERFVSPDLNKHAPCERPDVVSSHRQPRDAELVVSGLREVQRRSRVGDVGFDALGVVVIDCKNDGGPIWVLADQPPAPSPEDDFNYDRFINRVAHLYSTRFGTL